MLEVRPSQLQNAGDGLFATKKIHRYHTISCVHSRPRNADTSIHSEVIDFFLPPIDEIDCNAMCVYNGHVMNLKKIAPLCKKIVFNKRYVHMRKDDPIMKANDLAWNVGHNLHDYQMNTSRNQLDLILELMHGSVVGVRLLFNRDVEAGEELGITYGPTYWDL